MSSGPPSGYRTYVGTVIAVGVVPTAVAVWLLIARPVDAGWMLLAWLSLLSGALAIRIPSIEAPISFGGAIVFAAGLLFGAPAAAITAALDRLGLSLWKRERSITRTLFAIAEGTISASLAMFAFDAVARAMPLLNPRIPLPPMALPLLASAAIYVAFSTAITRVAVGLESGTPPILPARDDLLPLAVNFCLTVSVAAAIVRTGPTAAIAAVLVLVPMLLASYRSSREAARRLAETDRRLSELRRLYDSTVETLAMAVDAKDQITHGHVRRVQLLGTRLARALGASIVEIRALEAAALLHDLGKLAVPERILNKPGPLTPGEYEQMKSHAEIGAGILSRIDFPFPVVPIVRHHHEHWDGRGYPDGLSGTQIPLGARILAVVDCYDALTSDRPFRRRMTRDDAMEIIRRRAGQMYDPAVVDAFYSLYPTLSPQDVAGDDGDRSPFPLPANTMADPSASVPAVVTTRPLRERRQRVYDFMGRMGHASLEELGAALTRFVSDAQPDVAAALYRFDGATQQLVLVDAADSLKGILPGLVRLDSGVTGWVGSHQAVMANADAALDLGDACGAHRRLRMCLSAPILHEGHLAGVLTVYSSCAFSEGDRLVIEVIAEELGPLLARGTGGDPDAPMPVRVGRPPIEVVH